jgi:hypothetical protein
MPWIPPTYDENGDVVTDWEWQEDAPVDPNSYTTGTGYEPGYDMADPYNIFNDPNSSPNDWRLEMGTQTTPPPPEAESLLTRLGNSAANALIKRYTDGSGNADWSNILKDGATALMAYKAYQQASQPTPPTGYQGGIPKFAVDRQAVPVAAGARPGAGGQRYLTDVKYAAGLPAAQAAAQAQQGVLAQQNQQAVPQAAAPARDPNSDAFYGRQPMQAMAKGGLAGRYLQGQTDGMADKIPAQIDGKQPAALAHGEFVIPADVVSHLGNGNSDAGAQQLYKMMEKIRKARTGSKKQGKQINPEKFTAAAGGLAYAAGGAVQHFDAGGVTPTATNGVTGTESNLSNWVGPYVTDMLGKGQALSEMPYQAYQGPLTAGDSSLQSQAFGNAANLQVPGAIGQAANTAGGIAGTQQTSSFTAPGTAQQYMSPYMQQVVDMQKQEAQRTADIATTGRHSDQAKQGAFGGSRGAIMDAEAARNLATQQGTIQAQGLQSAFDNAQKQFNTEQTTGLAGVNTQLQAAGTQGNLGVQQGQAGIAALNAQLGAGNVQQATEQAGVAADQNAFNQEQANPYKMVQYQQSLLQGLPLAAQSYNITNNPYAAAANVVTGINSAVK